MLRYKIFNAVQKIKSVVTTAEFLESFRTAKTAFTRVRKMPFCDIIYFMLSSKRRCVQHELNEFINQKGKKTMTRQAFAKSREYIKHEAIKEINRQIIEDFDKQDQCIETLHGHRVFGVDGSIIDLPENDKLRDTFGFSTGSAGSSHCKARSMIVFDLFNHINTYGELISFFRSETTQMHDISDYIAKIETYNQCIFVLDRAYPSIKLFMKMQSNGQYFLMRAAKSFYKEVVNTTEPDTIVSIGKKNKKTKVRVIRFTLSSCETEILTTNLPNDFTYEELVKLYAKRRDIETNYHYLKNVELLECFTGESVTAVLQDYYAGVLMLNMAAIAYREQEEILNKEAIENPKKHKYKPNNKQIIYDIKTGFVKMIGANTAFARVFRQLIFLHRIKQFAYAEVLGRHKPRPDPKRHSTLKTHPKSPL